MNAGREYGQVVLAEDHENIGLTTHAPPWDDLPREASPPENAVRAALLRFMTLIPSTPTRRMERAMSQPARLLCSR